MSVEVRLEKCQTALCERGVKDVKFQFGMVSEKSLSQLASDAADALEAVNSGEYKDLPPLGDTARR